MQIPNNMDSSQIRSFVVTVKTSEELQIKLDEFFRTHPDLSFIHTHQTQDRLPSYGLQITFTILYR